jgi:hypothetical protein
LEKHCLLEFILIKLGPSTAFEKKKSKQVAHKKKKKTRTQRLLQLIRVHIVLIIKAIEIA